MKSVIRHLCLSLVTLIALCNLPVISYADNGTSLEPATRTVVDLAPLALTGKTDSLISAISYGFDPNEKDADGRTLIMFAAYNGHTSTVEMLIGKGAEISIADVEGTTPLMWASSGPFVDTVDLLLKKGASVNAIDSREHFTALMWAASEGQLEVVELLLKHNADMTLQDVDGDTAESFARQKGHAEVVKLLQSKSK